MSTNGKIPPQSIDLEEAILGAIMIEKDAINSVVGILIPESFYKESHRVIYKAILDLFHDNEPIDLLTVTNRLKKNGKLEIAGGHIAVTELTSKVSSSVHIDSHALIVKEQEMRRSIIRMASESIKSAYNTEIDIFDLIDNVSGSLIDINTSFDHSKSNPVRSYLPEVITDIENASKTKDHLTGINTGIGLVNKFTGGWQDGNLIIVAARPSMGKTDVAINFSMNAAKTGKKVAFFSLEMSGKEITKRILSIETEIYRNKVKTGKLNESDWNLITKIKNEVLDNILIQDNPSLTAIKFHSVCKMLKLKHNIDLIVVDYIQLMDGSKKGSRENEVSEISRKCKMVGMDLKVPVIALSQLSREVEKRGGAKRPILSDLRESGSIEQDANIVIFPYRAEKYDILEDDEGNTTENIMEFIFAKNRDGMVGTVKTKYLDSIGKIYDIDHDIKTEPEPMYRPDKFISSGLSEFDNDKAPF